MGDTPKQHPGYEEMKDTPWITQGREIADIGGRGVLENYNKVNVFNEPTQASLEARNNAIYKRAFDNMEKAYTNTMNKYNAHNYNQFGTLNATSPSYITDNYKRDFQRQMDDLAYNQAVNYDTLMDKELNRRYNTLNMFNSLYNYGATPYEQDLMNWDIRNKNIDISYNNAIAQQNNKISQRKNNAGIGSALGGIGGTLVGSYFGGPVGANIGSKVGQAAGGAIGGWI